MWFSLDLLLVLYLFEDAGEIFGAIYCPGFEPEGTCKNETH
jgi:hypothetical protein